MSYMDFPKSGMMHSGSVYGVPSLDYNNVGREYISLPTPTVSSAKGESPKSVFREPYLPWELGGVYPGWGERWDLPEPRTFGSTNELPNLADRNKCVGNAVQPLMAQYLFECIKCFDQWKS